MGRGSMVFYESWIGAIKNLPREVQGEVLTAIIEYGLYGETTESLKPITRAMLDLVKPQIDNNNKRYENGCKGGRKKSNQNQSETKSEPNQNQSETYNDKCKNDICKNDIEEKELSNESPKKKETSSFPQAEPKFFEDDKPSEKIDYDRIVDLYHKACPSYPKLIKLSDKRKAKIRVRFEEMKYDYQTIATIFCKMEASKFLKGDNKNGWKATFDWVLENANNWVKVLEGQYDNKQEQKPTSSPPAGVQLGYGERIVDGRRTYGTGKSTIPMNAPPRPGDGYSWSAEANKWVY